MLLLTGYPYNTSDIPQKKKKLIWICSKLEIQKQNDGD